MSYYYYYETALLNGKYVNKMNLLQKDIFELYQNEICNCMA